MPQECFQVHDIAIGDTLTPFGAQLLQDGSPAPLAGKDVYFYGVKENGDVWIPETEAEIIDEDLAKVQYQFDPSVVTVGKYYAYFLVYNSGHTRKDTYPAARRTMVINVSDY
jgi:hypothetical protein